MCFVCYFILARKQAGRLVCNHNCVHPHSLQQEGRTRSFPAELIERDDLSSEAIDDLQLIDMINIHNNTYTLLIIMIINYIIKI